MVLDLLFSVVYNLRRYSERYACFSCYSLLILSRSTLIAADQGIDAGLRSMSRFCSLLEEQDERIIIPH